MKKTDRDWRERYIWIHMMRESDVERQTASKRKKVADGERERDSDCESKSKTKRNRDRKARKSRST